VDGAQHSRRGRERHGVPLDDEPPVGGAQRIPWDAVQRAVGDDDEARHASHVRQRRIDQPRRERSRE
jgi:hypothetical protein